MTISTLQSSDQCTACFGMQAETETRKEIVHREAKLLDLLSELSNYK